MKLIPLIGILLVNSRRFLLVMRIALFLIITSAVTAFSANTYSQDTKISLSLKDVTVKEVFEAIEDQTEFIFFYQDQQVDLYRKISIDAKDKGISDILHEVFKNTRNVFIIRDRQIVIGESPQQLLKAIPPNGKLLDEKSQSYMLTGQVVDQSTMEPLPGVNILVENTHIGTITDADGKYLLEAPSDTCILVFSFIGFTTDRIAVNRKSVIDVALIPDIQKLMEVVVVGYGTQKKVNLSGAVDVISSDELENRPVTNVVQALQGMSPNLNVTVGNEGGEPGGQMNLNIRGMGSISGNTGDPYILVDGIEQNIYNINPNDIESISVLKDAAASAIYGARAAFGVILITTKKGKTNGISLTYSNNFSYAKPINLPKTANSLDFANYFNEAARNDGNVPIFQPIIIENIIKYQAGELEDWTIPMPWAPNLWLVYQGGWANTDWFKVDYRDWVPRQTHNLSISGGNERTQFYISGSVFDQDGLMRYGDDSFIRNNLNLKVNTSVNKWLRINYLTKFNYTNLDRPSYNKELFYHNIARRWPTNGVYFPDGNLNYDGEQIWLQNGGRYIAKTNELTVIPGLEIEPVKDWIIYANYRWRLNFDGYTNHEAKVTGTFVDGTPFYQRAYNNFSVNSYESYYNSPNVYSSYLKKFGAHEFSILAGFEQEEVKYTSNYSRKDDLISDDIPSLGTATGKEYVDGSIGHWATRSFFGRFNYNYKEKYLLELSARRDGSSKFEQGNRWGTFPSGSVAYILSRESYWQSIEKYVSMLKFRGSYGSLGNQDVANYLYVERLPISTNLPYILGDGRPNYVGMSNLPSPNLTWEKINTLNFGVDAGFLNDRLTASADYFIRHTYEMLGPVESLPAVLGTAVPQTNNATLRTQGFEFVLGWRESKSKFRYDLNFILSNASSEVIDYYNPENLLSAPYYEGKTVGEIWGYTTAGLFQTDDEAENWDQSYLSGEVWRAGDVKYTDLNNDEKINVGKNTVDDHGDLSIIGNFLPRYSYSFLINAFWKGIDMKMIWQGVGERDLWLDGSHFWGAIGGLWQATAFEEHLDYWSEENTDAYFPRPYLDKGRKNHQVQTRYLQNGAYLRLKSLQIGYTLPSSLTEKAFIRNLRFYATGENLLTFSSLSKVFDPEATGGYYGSGKVYPLQMNLSFGLNITF